MKLWSWSEDHAHWLQVDQGPAAAMAAAATRRNAYAREHGITGAAYLAYPSTPTDPPSTFGLTPVPPPTEPDPEPDRWASLDDGSGEVAHAFGGRMPPHPDRVQQARRETRRAIGHDDGRTVTNVERADVHLVTHLDDPGVVAAVAVLPGATFALTAHELGGPRGDHTFTSTIVTPRDHRSLDDLLDEARQLVGERVGIRKAKADAGL